MELFDRVIQTITDKSVNEIIYDNLCKFFFIDNNKKISFNLLKKKYAAELYNELEKPLEYFEESIIDIKKNLDKYIKVLKLMQDEKSKNAFVNMVAAKVFMDVSYIEKAYTTDSIYFDDSIFSFEKEIYVDCGGYDGDTAADFIFNNPDVQRVYIFEGIGILAEKCKKRFQNSPFQNKITVVEKAVTDKEGKIFFSLGEGKGDSRIDSAGDIIVQTTALDMYIKDKVTFIKMDIEGSEKEAIRGTANIISTYSPKMAICIYHLKDDFWKIPELIMSINPNYRFMVRQHDPIAYSETVLYCIPKKMKKANAVKEKELSKIEYDLCEYRKGRIWYFQQIREKNSALESGSLLYEELKVWCNELQEGKKWIKSQYKDIKVENKKLHKWCDELWEGKNWIESQYKEIKTENEKLHKWCEELQEGKNWIESQYRKIETENEKLHKWCEKLQERKNWIESQYKEIETENERLHKWCENLQEGRDWLQNENKGIKEENEKLHRWCEDLQEGRDWLQNENKGIKEENEKLHRWCEDLQEGRDWLQNENKGIKEENEKLHRWCENLQEGRD